MTDMDAIRVKNLSFSYTKENQNLSDLNFTVESGKYVSIIGHNGSGKSTLAKLIIGLLEPSNGEIYIFDQKIDKKNIACIRQQIALVFQNPDNQFIGATVEDDIAFGLENRNIPSKEMHDIVLEYASKVGMEEYLNAEPSRLSGGQKQRVAIAGALSLSPKILILDEATSMLDPKGKEDIRNLIKSLREQNKDLTILSITHDVEEAFLSDYVLLLDQGKVIKAGEPEAIFFDQKVLEEHHLKMPFYLEFKQRLLSENLLKNSSSHDLKSLLEEL